MKVVVQRSKKSSVSVSEKIVNEIDKHIKENEQFNLLKTISDCREKVDAEVPFGKEDAYDTIINEVDNHK